MIRSADSTRGELADVVAIGARRPCGRVIAIAYRDTRALDRPCPNCCAGVGQWCTTPDGHVRRIPCVPRCTRAADVETETHAADFTEPRHPKGPK